MGLKHSTVLGRRKRIRGGALPDKGIATEVSDEAIVGDKVAGKSLLMRSVTLIEYVLLISVVSLVICVAGPPVAEAIQGQFGKIEEVISNGTSGGPGGGGGDLPGGGSGNEQGGGGENPDKPGGGDTGGGTDPEKPTDPDQGGTGGGQQGTPLTGKVIISDTTPITGDTVTANVSGTQSGAQLSYQWKADGVAIQGATKTSYTLTDKEVGKALTCDVADTSDNFDNSITSNVSHPYASWAKSADTKVADTVAAADAGTIKLTDYWKSGDKRTVKLSSMGTISGISETHAAQSVEYVLSDPGHFTLANGKKCSFTVIQKDCLKQTGRMDTSDTNIGGWDKAPRRTWCNTTYRNALPAALRPIFKQFKVTTANGNGSGTTVSTDYFSLFSEKEVFGTTRYANAAAESANTQLEYFKTSGNRVKKTGDGVGRWWERSAYSGDSVAFCYVRSDGSAYIENASNYLGLAPFGCI